jgi:GATA-binding protein
VSLPEMSGAATPQYDIVGGILHRAAEQHSSSDNMIAGASGEAQSNPTSSTSTSTTEHDFRFPRRPTVQKSGEASSSSTVTPQPGNTTNSDTSTKDSSASAVGKLDFSVGNSARKELLRETIFPAWKDDTAGEELDSPDEMQRKDPLATQIWRLYSKTKKQLPNQERMENLTWRMMAMSLRKRKQEEAARYV